MAACRREHARYDSRGNTVARDDQVFTFDRAQRLLDARLMSTVLQSYRYDAHGRRTASTLPNGDQRYQVYSRSGQLLFEAIKPIASPVLTRTTDYIYLGGSLIAKRRIEDIVTVPTEQRVPCARKRHNCGNSMRCQRQARRG